MKSIQIVLALVVGACFGALYVETGRALQAIAFASSVMAAFTMFLEVREDKRTVRIFVPDGVTLNVIPLPGAVP